jgi:hypothetical protein
MKNFRIQCLRCDQRPTFRSSDRLLRCKPGKAADSYLHATLLTHGSQHARATSREYSQDGETVGEGDRSSNLCDERLDTPRGGAQGL